MQFSYDGGDLVVITDALGRTSNQFVDSLGRVVGRSNSLGQRVRYEYDALNRLTRITDALQGTTNFAYDPNGNLLNLTDARNGVTSYAYNNSDQVTTRTDPLLHDTTYEYNPDGTLHQVTDRKNQITSYSYDPLNRLTQVTYADSTNTTFTYDAGNRLTQVVDSISGTTTFAYDGLDCLTSKTNAQGTVSYGYDAAGRRTSATVTGQPAVNYSYDDANRLTQITQGSAIVTLSYDVAGRRTSLTLPNGVVTEYTYDDSSQLTALTYKHGATELGSLTYSYDLAGRRTHVGGSYARASLPQSVGSTSYNSANQQTTFAGQTLTYDLNGNLTSDGTTSYVWNARNQLASLSKQGLTASFMYDGVGNRVSLTVNGTSTSFLLDGDNLVQESSGGSATATLLTGDLDEPLTRTEANGTFGIIADALGSTLALTDATGTVQTQYTYEPFGSTTNGGTLSNNASQYAGRENDDTGLYYYRNRYYSPILHRFIAEDPIGLAGGTNVYAYVGNDPINFRDPSGLKPNNPGDDGDDRADKVRKMFRDLINGSKANMHNVLLGAALEGLGPLFSSLELVKGSSYYAEIGSSQGKLGMMADISVDGKILKLDNFAVYPTNAEGLKLGTREMLELRQQLANEASALGFKELQITGIRYGGANPGRVVSVRIPLKR